MHQEQKIKKESKQRHQVGATLLMAGAMRRCSWLGRCDVAHGWGDAR